MREVPKKSVCHLFRTEQIEDVGECHLVKNNSIGM